MLFIANSSKVCAFRFAEKCLIFGLEGVFAIKDDVHTTYTFGKDENDQEITVGSLKVIKLLQSLWSRGYVKKTYSW